MSGEFSGKTVLVTGAASGIGRETALQFHSSGANVVISDIDEEQGAKTCADFSDPARVLFAPHDVRSAQSWQQTIKRMIDSFGGFDILVNNAGMISTTSLEDMSLDEWQNQNAVNLDSVFLGTQAAIGHMKKSRGAIVNVASVAAEIGIHTAAGYCAGKAGVKGFAKAAALYCAHHKYDIRINSVLPGYVETPMVTDIADQTRSPDRVMQFFADAHPIGRIGEPADIANAILFAASDKAKFMTGSSITVDGGYLAQ